MQNITLEDIAQFINTGRKDLAYQVLSELNKQQTTAEMDNILGVLYWKGEFYHEAIMSLQQALNKNPKNTTIQQNLRSILDQLGYKVD